MRTGRQLIRPVAHPEKEPHDYQEHDRLVGVCDACGWPEYDHFTFEAMVANLQAGLNG